MSYGGRSGEPAAGGVGLGQERDVSGRLAALEGLGQGLAVAVVDVVATAVLGEERGELGVRETGYLGEITLIKLL